MFLFKSSKSDSEEEDEELGTSTNSQTDTQDLMWGNMIDPAPVQPPRDDATIRLDCETELKLYLMEKGLPLKDNKGVWHNPLDWWKIETKYIVLKEMAQAFLSVTASSAPSERVWSRAAQILSIKRALLNEDVSSGVMFVKENLPILRKHYTLLTHQDKKALPLELTGIPLPDDDLDIDVGQDLFDINETF